MRTKTISIVLLIFVLIVALSYSQQNPQWKGKITKLGDLTIVKNPKEPIYKDPILELSEDLALGGLKDDGTYVFGAIRSFIVDADGNFFVLDYKDLNVKVFNKMGIHIRTFGRKGQGPGELERPQTISINESKGELAIYNMDRRMSFFRLDGSFLRSIVIKELMAGRGVVDSQGHIFIMSGYINEGGGGTHFKVKKLSPEGILIKIIAKSPGPKSDISNPYLPIPFWRIDSDNNIIYGYPNSYEINFYRHDDCKIFKRILKNYDPIKIPDDIKKRAKNSLNADHYPAYRRFFLSDEGYLFVQTWEKLNDNRIMYDIFDPDGKYINALPLKPRGIEVKSDKFYALEEDENGNQIIKRYKVKWNLNLSQILRSYDEGSGSISIK